MEKKKIVLKRSPRRENPLKKGTLAQQEVQRQTEENNEKKKKCPPKKLFCKKYLILGSAVLLAVLVVVGILLFGKKEREKAPGTSTTAAATTAPLQKEAIGTLVVAFGAHIELQYDDEGKVVSIQGVNDLGKQIVENCTGFEGRDAVFGVRAFLRYASDHQLLGDAKTMTVRVKYGDPLPAEDFLETIAQDNQYLADEECTGILVMAIGEERLDENGMIDLETVQKMATRFLGAVLVADLGGDETPVGNYYTFDCEGKVCTVDAVTGLIEMKTT